jgi:hypothetical protein
MRFKPFIFLFFVFSSLLADAQSSPTPSSMETPSWVIMMEDPTTNYFAAIEAYKSYWETHVRPPGEEEEMERNANGRRELTKEEEREREREERRKKKLSGAALEQTEYLKYQSKRFENWAREVKPWVQEDGHILTYEERNQIWLKQQQEQQEKK